jgi:hypothetical protein
MKAIGTLVLAAFTLVGVQQSIAVDDRSSAADDLADRPKSLEHEAEIAGLLEEAAWVSPNLSKEKVLYMVSWQSCPYCLAYERDDFPKLQAAGVDTRVIVYARASSSTPQERAGVAELWRHRSWELWKRFVKVPTSAWTAEGLPPDTDPDSVALVAKSQDFADKMRVLMSENGIGTRQHLNLPTLIWRGKDGHLRGCGCEKVEVRKYVLEELGAG